MAEYFIHPSTATWLGEIFRALREVGESPIGSYVSKVEFEVDGHPLEFRLQDEDGELQIAIDLG